MNQLRDAKEWESSQKGYLIQVFDINSAKGLVTISANSIPEVISELESYERRMAKVLHNHIEA